MENNNKRGIFYGVIGVATLVVAIIGATFAYFTASADVSNNITGNMASVSFGLGVAKVTTAGDTSGLIPMSNNMVEQAVSNASQKGVCIDAAGNAVCQIYEVTVTNNSTAAMFVDGYVALTGGSGIPTDYTSSTLNQTTMRWAQVFPTGAGTTSTSTATYSTAGSYTIGVDSSNAPVYVELTPALGHAATDPYAANATTNTTDIKTANVTGNSTIAGSSYTTISTNYIRVSDHTVTSGGTGTVADASISSSFNRTDDVTSTLVLSQQLQPSGDENDRHIAKLYFVVWLSETGTDQTAGKTITTPATTNPAAANFFKGMVAFISAQGSEVTATFTGYAAVQSDNTTTTN